MRRSRSLPVGFTLAVLAGGCGGSAAMPEVDLGDTGADESAIGEAGGEVSVVDSGAGEDTSVGEDTASAEDTAVAVDTSTVTDTGSITDTGAAVDTATTTDTGAPIDTGLVDTGTTIDTGVDTGTTCGAVSDGKYYVDPVSGSDGASTGRTTCPFKTITRALQFLNATYPTGTIPAGTQVLLRNRATAATGELFPLSVPANVTVRSELATSIQTIEVASGRTGFNLSQPSSGLASLIIDGNGVALAGVGVGGSASKDTTVLAGVTVTGMRNDGIYVESGGLKIAAGVQSIKNGVSPTSSQLGSGLHVRGGVVVVTVNAGEATTKFDENAANGILVDSAGAITVTGKPDLTGFPTTAPPAVTSGTGTITVNLNKLAGVGVVQGGGATGVNTFTGLVVWKNVGNGFRFYTPSRVVVRDSVSIGNGRNGIEISASSVGTSVANMDLGGDTFGRNIFQSTVNPNSYAGICVDWFYGNTVYLRAKGNHFKGKSCAVTPAPTPLPLLTVAAAGGDCAGAGGIDVAAARSGSGAAPTKVTVDLDNCVDAIWP